MKKKLINFKELGMLNIVFQFGIVVLSNVFVGGLIGYLLMKYANMGKFWLILFLMLGIFSGLYQGIKYLLKEAEKYERSNKDGDKGNNGTDNSGTR
ncbi:AtpZ/AtpI family protein [Kosmotoga arenicorallina]|nr:AtpZ/AtpI family protein [Kosmotoga arenicorallina]